MKSRQCGPLCSENSMCLPLLPFQMLTSCCCVFGWMFSPAPDTTPTHPARQVQCCIRCLSQGVNAAHIIDGRSKHSVLMELLTDEVRAKGSRGGGSPGVDLEGEVAGEVCRDRERGNAW